jgi:hypothetical protein
MGQYHKIVNLDKKQFLHPHTFGDGLKLMEFGQSSSGTLLGLTVLLSCSNGRGGGDIRSDSDLVGLWVGDRIAIVGDYSEAGDLAPEHDAENLYSRLNDEDFEDISDKVVAMLKEAGEWVRDGEESRFA